MRLDRTRLWTRTPMIWLVPIVVALAVALLGAAVVLGYGALVLRAERTDDHRRRPPAHEPSGEAP